VEDANKKRILIITERNATKIYCCITRGGKG